MATEAGNAASLESRMGMENMKTNEELASIHKRTRTLLIIFLVVGIVFLCLGIMLVFVGAIVITEHNIPIGVGAGCFLVGLLSLMLSFGFYRKMKNVQHEEQMLYRSKDTHSSPLL